MKVVLTSYAALILILPEVALGADQSPQQSFEQILGDDSEIDAAQLWSRILESDFHLSSEAPARKGFFEAWVAGPTDEGGALTVYWQFDDNGCTRSRYRPRSLPKAGLLNIDRAGFMLDSECCWQRQPAPNWSFCFDQEHLDRPWDPVGVPEHEGGYIRFSLGSYLKTRPRPDVPAVSNSAYRWDAAILTLERHPPGRLRTRLRFRTPNDQRRFGTLLGELSEYSAETANIRNFRSFIVDRTSPLRLNIESIEEVSQKLDAVDSFLIPEKRGPLLADSDDDLHEEEEASYRIIQTIGFLKCEGQRRSKAKALESRFHEGIAVCRLAYDRWIEDPLWAGKKPPKLAEFMEFTIRELEKGYQPLVKAVTEGGSDPLLDDPGATWLAFNRAIGPTMLHEFYNGGFQSLLRSTVIPPRSKLHLCGVLSEFGCPLGAELESPPLSGPDASLLEVIRHARWCWPPSDDEIAVCVRYLDSDEAEGEARRAAIDSLVRWGRFDLIPETILTSWLDDHRNATPAWRHWTWKALSRTPRGRELLRQTMADETFATTIRDEIAQVLRYRAEATLELKRFDFMSEDECRKTLETCVVEGS